MISEARLEGPSAGHEALPLDFRITLPPGWVRIPLDERAPEVIALLAKRRAATMPVGQQEQVRIALAKLMHDCALQAQSAGGIDLLLSTEPVNGITVPALCLITYTDPRTDARVGVEQLRGQLTAPGAEVAVLEWQSGPIIRRALTRLEPVPPSPEQPAPSPLVITEIAYWTAVPGRPGLLALTFSTPVAELAEALTGLFDAMAATFWWVPR